MRRIDLRALLQAVKLRGWSVAAGEQILEQLAQTFQEAAQVAHIAVMHAHAVPRLLPVVGA